MATQNKIKNKHNNKKIYQTHAQGKQYTHHWVCRSDISSKIENEDPHFGL